ncbi:hypothetical protein N7507_011240 [Penicillium longicatenatum]|nr:hypothetical protein N7507_011240 [Penicillium longicatenatum]
MEASSSRIPFVSPVIDAIATMKTSVANIMSLLIELSGSTRAKYFLLRCEMIQESVRNTLSPILIYFQSFSQTEMELNLPSDEYMKIGFVKAFEYIKDVSREHSEIEISGAHILVPDFFKDRIRDLVLDAALEAGIHAIGIQSPQEMIKSYNGILDEVIKPFGLDARPEQQNHIIIDYGLRYLHIHTQSGRCRMKRALDSMSCSRVPYNLYHRVISVDGPLSRQIDNGASRDDLHEAVWRARFAMKQATETDEDQDHYEEWPLDLQDWWVGEDEGAVLRWEDVQAAEEEYIDKLSDILIETLDCIQGRGNEDGVRSNPIHRVIVLGNFCDRPLVKKAIKKSVGEHVKIIGGNSELDNALAAKGGARQAFFLYDALKCDEKADMQFDSKNDEL